MVKGTYLLEFNYVRMSQRSVVHDLPLDILINLQKQYRKLKKLKLLIKKQRWHNRLKRFWIIQTNQNSKEISHINVIGRETETEEIIVCEKGVNDELQAVGARVGFSLF
jgi:hypothetical protein